ncbi:uncharacterized protein ARMOST_00375 [Armillaria ostoyae]|uniref:Uncharacterized protein n=1 Tax=Armillaria ostoyae TaxID=47428 RepID=A0A284QKX2_ARMOS|nr:uncharacterized protein ARMOST_00375 [Armillaria ostoyae]
MVISLTHPKTVNTTVVAWITELHAYIQIKEHNQLIIINIIHKIVSGDVEVLSGTGQHVFWQIRHRSAWLKLRFFYERRIIVLEASRDMLNGFVTRIVRTQRQHHSAQHRT